MTYIAKLHKLDFLSLHFTCSQESDSTKKATQTINFRSRNITVVACNTKPRIWTLITWNCAHYQLNAAVSWRISLSVTLPPELSITLFGSLAGSRSCNFYSIAIHCPSLSLRFKNWLWSSHFGLLQANNTTPHNFFNLWGREEQCIAIHCT